MTRWRQRPTRKPTSERLSPIAATAGDNRAMPVRKVLEAGRVPVKLYTEDIEPDALAQLTNR